MDGCDRGRRMKNNKRDLAKMFRKDARKGLEKYLSQIVRCLQLLSEKEIWWRPNDASNAAGNIVLHLSGNLRQWIISGLGGAPDARERDKEFSERGPVPRRTLISQLRKTVEETCETIDRISAEKLSQDFPIQGYQVSGLVAISHVYEHFAYHAGQIAYLTKLKRGNDLRFTRLPAEKSKRRRPKPFRA
jgi:uncharacterized damage-inducible protein DinB